MEKFSHDSDAFFRHAIQRGTDYIFAYETPKVVNIHSKKIGAIHRLVQAAIIAYVIGYVFIWCKGYQEEDRVESSVVTKVKGLIKTVPPYPLNTHIWDSIDFVIPPQENNAFFIATNLIAAPNQMQADCPEVATVLEIHRVGLRAMVPVITELCFTEIQSDPVSGGQRHNANDSYVEGPGVYCQADADCPRDTPIINGNGFRTGRCINHTGTCEISAWCPTEVDKRPEIANLAGSEYFTVLVKNHIMFPKFGFKRRNILETLNRTYLANCRFNPKTDPYCPIFVVRDILDLATSKESYAEMSQRGGVMGFIIEWNCNLDFSPDYCLPAYSFRRMDNKHDTLAKGWNFRYAHYWTDQYGIGRRTMLKAYGIRFVFNVYGKAGKFSLVVFAMNLGSGLGLLGIATILCDFILLNCVKNRKMFQEYKFIRLESKVLRKAAKLEAGSKIQNGNAQLSRPDLHENGAAVGKPHETSPLDGSTRAYNPEGTGTPIDAVVASPNGILPRAILKVPNRKPTVRFIDA